MIAAAGFLNTLDNTLPQFFGTLQSTRAETDSNRGTNYSGSVEGCVTHTHVSHVISTDFNVLSL